MTRYKTRETEQQRQENTSFYRKLILYKGPDVHARERTDTSINGARKAESAHRRLKPDTAAPLCQKTLRNGPRPKARPAGVKYWKQMPGKH